MVSHLEYNEQYGNASQLLTNAISEMAESVDTPDFNKAFWKVQRASQRCKRVRAANEQAMEQPRELLEASVILT